jgi:hypothetical protein
VLRPLPIVTAASVLLLAACGGHKESAPTTPTTARDPGREVLGAFVTAAAAGDSKAMWELLSKPSQRRAGPTLAAFAAGKAKELRRTLSPFAKDKLPVQVSENISDRFGIVALSRGTHAYAVPLRHEGDVWRVELPGPVRLEVLGPPPGSRGKFVDQIGVEVHGRGSEGPAVVYADGVTLDANEYGGPKSATVYANLEGGLEKGRHTAVAYAERGNNAAARAWVFWS